MHHERDGVLNCFIWGRRGGGKLLDVENMAALQLFTPGGLRAWSPRNFGSFRSNLRHTELASCELAHRVAHPYHHRSLSYWNWNYHYGLHVLGSIPSACTTHARP